MRLYSIIIFFLLGISFAARAQQPTRSDLEKRRASLLNEIANTQQQLEDTKKDKKATKRPPFCSSDGSGVSLARQS